MKLVFRNTELQRHSWQKYTQSSDIECLYANLDIDLFNYTDADYYINLLPEEKNEKIIEKNRIFIKNNVITLNNETEHNIRINSWNGFFENGFLEIFCVEDNKPDIADLFKQIGIKVCFSPNVVGLVSARIVAQIINEAYFALEENVSSKPEIDLAMKAGTNYPYGPFEWSELIGLENIHALLQKLSEEDNSLSIAPSLEKELTNFFLTVPTDKYC